MTLIFEVLIIVVSVVVSIIPVVVIISDEASVRTNAGTDGAMKVTDDGESVAISWRSTVRNELPVMRPAGIVDISSRSGEIYVT